MATKLAVWFKRMTLTFLSACSVIIFMLMWTSKSSSRHQLVHNKDISHHNCHEFQNDDTPEENMQILKLRYNQLRKLATDFKENCSMSWQPDCTIANNILATPLTWSIKSESKLTISNIPDVHVSDVSCSKLFHDDADEQKRAFDLQRLKPKRKIPDRSYIELSRNCDRFVTERRYITSPLSKEEEDFPLAFSILIFQDVEQFERLLRAIYRPQNFYCIHVDKKSDKFVHDTAAGISRCFPNVFVATQWYDVAWGTFSVLEPELACMEELLKYKKWKYFINLTGQEFPLKTNWEIVRILKIFNGANNLEGTVARRNVDRVHPAGLVPPANVTLTKGSVHVTASRAFVEYIIHDNNSLLFRDWVKETYVSDETYFSSLNHSPQLAVPGSYLGVPETDTDKNLFITRFKNWGDGPFNWPCGGKRVRQVCVFGIKDLPLLSSRPELFANKFHLYYDPLALDCMEELHFGKIQRELNGTLSFDTAIYESLDFVKNHL